MVTTNTSTLRSEFKTYLAQNLVDKFKVDSDDRLFVYTAGVTLSTDETTRSIRRVIFRRDYLCGRRLGLDWLIMQLHT